MQQDVILEKIKTVMNKSNYSFYENGIYNLNIIGVRKKKKKADNLFNDKLFVIFKEPDNKNFIIKNYSITTTPGISQLEDPSNIKGTAILVPNQYKGCWSIGLHKGEYEALVQTKPVSVYRDNNKDDNYDYSNAKIDKGMFGINIHRSNPKRDSIIVDNWSAGCQVFSSPIDFKLFMELCNLQNKVFKTNSFTYTLLKEEDLNYEL